MHIIHSERMCTYSMAPGGASEKSCFHIDMLAAFLAG